ncbi:MAG: Gp49 family protein [Alphaproteobacteria bacterium]
MNDVTIEQEIKDKGLNAPRVTLEGLHKKIVTVEITKFTSKTGQVLRWAVLTMENGFAVVGKPSCSVSPENDDAELGEKIAIQNSQEEVWALEGYALKQKLFEKTCCKMQS